MQFRSTALPLEEPLLVKLIFGISGALDARPVHGWTPVADGSFGATFTPTFFGGGNGTSCGLASASDCELTFIVPNGRGGFVDGGAQVSAGLSASGFALDASTAFANADFTHTITLDRIDVLYNGVVLDPSVVRIIASSGTTYPVAPVPDPAAGWLFATGLAVVAARRRGSAGSPAARPTAASPRRWGSTTAVWRRRLAPAESAPR